MLANDKWQLLTQTIMRGRGISMKLLGDQQGPTSDIDVKVLVQRINFMRRRILWWLKLFVTRYAAENKISKIPTVVFEKVSLEIEDLIKNRVMPMHRSGLLSPQTALQEAGYDYDNELRLKREAAPNSELFMPVPTFSQTTVNPDTPEKTALSDPYGGRGAGVVKAKDEWEGWATQVTAMFLVYAEGGSSDQLVSAMRSLNVKHMTDAYAQGYLTAGGEGSPDEDRVRGVVAWNNSYLDIFARELQARTGETHLTREGLQTRALMYPREGYRMAFAYGAFQAKREQGYSHWRRVMHPEASDSGPCQLCLEDSRVQHSLGEEFYEPHPNGVCSQTFLVFSRGELSSMPFVLPGYGIEKELGRLRTPRVERA
jgi:hypothetical protein